MERKVRYMGNGKRRMWLAGILLSSFFILNFFIGCDSIDCTINNVVTLNVGFYSSEDGSECAITDTLTITTEGSDSILYNRGSMVSKVALPMSYWQEADTLHFRFFNLETGLDCDIIIRLTKDNTPHFESPDCPATMFHELRAVTFEDNSNNVDSIIISNSSVNYDGQENVKIYLRTAD